MNTWIKVIPWILIIPLYIFLLVKDKSWFSDFNPTVLLKKYSQEEIDHFTNFAFQDGRLSKWEKNIVVKFQDNRTSNTSSIQSISQCIIQLNSILNEMPLLLSDKTNDYNVIVQFPDSLNSIFGYTSTKFSYFKIPYPTIKEGIIQIVIKNRKRKEIKSTTLHEFTHLLGFNHNFSIAYQSIFNPNPVTVIKTEDGIGETVPTFQKYRGLDKAAIRIMYDSDVAIDPGMTKDKFFRKIEEARKKMIK